VRPLPAAGAGARRCAHPGPRARRALQLGLRATPDLAHRACTPVLADHAAAPFFLCPCRWQLTAPAWEGSGAHRRLPATCCPWACWAACPVHLCTLEQPRPHVADGNMGSLCMLPGCLVGCCRFGCGFTPEAWIHAGWRTPGTQSSDFEGNSPQVGYAPWLRVRPRAWGVC
jgi:hypothetical protein